ncbi:MAG: DUF4365 domain-containing protein, partial [Bacteroidia bacterium]|nr:DUF4365 domain-containing protein [Bacteroidia bacterium]
MRNFTENDYGIDFEIELVQDDKVIGHYVKVQVKSKKEKLTLKDGTPSISGIEQSTLYYWSQLSYKANVHVIAVDLTKEEIYFSEPIFWQAIKLLSNDDSTKTVYLKKANKGSKIVDQLMHEFSQPTIPEILFSHKHALL